MSHFFGRVLGQGNGGPFKAVRVGLVGYSSRPKLHAEATFAQLRYVLYTPDGPMWAPAMVTTDGDQYITAPVTWTSEFQIVNVICADLIRFHLVKVTGKFPITMLTDRSAFAFEVFKYAKPEALLR